MAEERDYRPIDCGFHDRLEELAVLRRRVRISHAEADSTGGETETQSEGLIQDLFTTGSKEEFLRLENGITIRLDRIKTIDHIP